MKTRITDLLGCQYPVIQGGMAWVAEYHLAAAVCFTDSVSGDYIQLNGRKYIVSDPTYIGAPVGLTMPNMDNQLAKVILLQ